MAKRTLSGNVEIRYETVSRQIDIDTLLNSLLQFNNLIQDINTELNIARHLSREVELKVAGFVPGSFGVRLDLQTRDAYSGIDYLVRETPHSSVDILSVMGELVELKRLLRGKRPAKASKLKSGKIAVEAENGQRLEVPRIVYSIFTRNLGINEALDRLFDVVASDAEVGAFEIASSETASAIRAHRDEFIDLSRSNAILDQDTDVAVIPGTPLTIFKIVFHERFKWQFYYKGIRISAAVQDESFFKKIDEGEKFAKGDTLICDLQVNKVFDRSVNTYVNKSYQINRVHQHIPRPEQVRFDFES